MRASLAHDRPDRQRAHDQRDGSPQYFSIQFTDFLDRLIARDHVRSLVDDTAFVFRRRTEKIEVRLLGAGGGIVVIIAAVEHQDGHPDERCKVQRICFGQGFLPREAAAIDHGERDPRLDRQGQWRAVRAQGYVSDSALRDVGPAFEVID
jgi:hypothetical protein